jgi:NTP pyrophosphatase (non-canonical NTP hydrolase)
MNYAELEKLVEEWAENKGIFKNATPMNQVLKTLEETTELCVAVNKDNKDQIIDGIGDIIVTLIIQCKFQNVKLEDCLESVYNIISKRTGQMKDGFFVKD